MTTEIRKNRIKPASLKPSLRRHFCRAALVSILAFASHARAADSFNSVYISEFLAENQHGLQDSDGDYSGWIELYNASSDVVSLESWFLSDTATNLTKWRFPRVSILPSNYLVLFASGKGRIKDLAHLHTNFRLDKNG